MQLVKALFLDPEGQIFKPEEWICSTPYHLQAKLVSLTLNELLKSWNQDHPDQPPKTMNSVPMVYTSDSTVSIDAKHVVYDIVRSGEKVGFLGEDDRVITHMTRGENTFLVLSAISVGKPGAAFRDNKKLGHRGKPIPSGPALERALQLFKDRMLTTQKEGDVDYPLAKQFLSGTMTSVPKHGQTQEGFTEVSTEPDQSSSWGANEPIQGGNEPSMSDNWETETAMKEASSFASQDNTFQENDITSTEAPKTEACDTKANDTDAASTNAPNVDAPANEVATVEAPTSEAPATEFAAVEATATEVDVTSTSVGQDELTNDADNSEQDEDGATKIEKSGETSGTMSGGEVNVKAWNAHLNYSVNDDVDW